MKMKKTSNASTLAQTFIGGLLIVLLVGCGAAETETAAAPSGNTPNSGSQMGRGMGMGNGMSGMMARHHATVPAEYAGLTNPVPADEASLQRGAEIYERLCVSCHGAGGMGDGVAAATLDPAPAAVAHTSRMLGDDYLFWRVTEGGHEFTTAMPAWDQALEETARWDVINYIRALGQGTAMPGGMMDGAAFNPTAEAAQHAAMLEQGVADGVITQAEAVTFAAVHAQMDDWMNDNQEAMRGGMGQMQHMILEELVAAGAISAEDADVFNDVHDRLIAAGLME